MAEHKATPSWQRGLRDSIGPVTLILAVTVAIWYVAAVGLNAAGTIERVLAPRGAWTAGDLVRETLSMQRPVLPAPHQVAVDLWHSIVDWPLDSPRNRDLSVRETEPFVRIAAKLRAVLGRGAS